MTGVAIGSTAANSKINAGAVIVQVRDMAVTSPDGVQRGVEDERKQQHPFVPMLLAEPSGLRLTSVTFGGPPAVCTDVFAPCQGKNGP